MKNEIPFSGYDYICIRMDDVFTDKKDADGMGLGGISIESFGSLNHAREWAEADIADTLRRCGLLYEDVEKPSRNHFVIETDGYSIEWEIRKVHHRTTGKWNDVAFFKWKREK